uniref:Uncharacterized protein n=1 Tax=Glossina pallidipes TaxID=7398 RepID=A0A1B0A2V6_GLOPL
MKFVLKSCFHQSNVAEMCSGFPIREFNVKSKQSLTNHFPNVYESQRTLSKTEAIHSIKLKLNQLMLILSTRSFTRSGIAFVGIRRFIMPARKEDITLHQAMLADSSCNKLHKLVTINERWLQQTHTAQDITMTFRYDVCVYLYARIIIISIIIAAIGKLKYAKLFIVFVYPSTDDQNPNQFARYAQLKRVSWLDGWTAKRTGIVND